MNRDKTTIGSSSVSEDMKDGVIQNSEESKHVIEGCYKVCGLVCTGAVMGDEQRLQGPSQFETWAWITQPACS